MTKRPITINSTHYKRLMRVPVGSGFFLYRSSESAVEVVEFMLSPDGDILRPDGTPLEYRTQDGDESPVMRYRWVREQVQE